MDASTILEVTRTLIDRTDPCGDSAIDRERMQNLDTLIHVIDVLLDDVREVSTCKYSHEGSMRTMGQMAYKALQDWREWLDSL